MPNTFYGQELNCYDDYLTEWHSCPNCGRALIYCECDESESLCNELADLYKHKEVVDA